MIEKTKGFKYDSTIDIEKRDRREDMMNNIDDLIRQLTDKFEALQGKVGVKVTALQNKADEVLTNLIIATENKIKDVQNKVE